MLTRTLISSGGTRSPAQKSQTSAQLLPRSLGTEGSSRNSIAVMVRSNVLSASLMASRREIRSSGGSVCCTAVASLSWRSFAPFTDLFLLVHRGDDLQVVLLSLEGGSLRAFLFTLSSPIPRRCHWL